MNIAYILETTNKIKIYWYTQNKPYVNFFMSSDVTFKVKNQYYDNKIYGNI